MKRSMLRLVGGKESPQELRREVQEGESLEMKLRRGTVVSSLIGAASMAAVTLYQMGVIRHLPDPPLDCFNSDKVNGSDTAWGFGVPDGTLTMMAHAMNIAFAAAGGERRAEIRPALPIAASIAAGAQAIVAAKYLFYQMPYMEKALCLYCIVDALSHLVTFGLTIPEAKKALKGR